MFHDLKIYRIAAAMLGGTRTPYRFDAVQGGGLLPDGRYEL